MASICASKLPGELSRQWLVQIEQIGFFFFFEQYLEVRLVFSFSKTTSVPLDLPLLPSHVFFPPMVDVEMWLVVNTRSIKPFVRPYMLPSCPLASALTTSYKILKVLNGGMRIRHTPPEQINIQQTL